MKSTLFGATHDLAPPFRRPYGRRRKGISIRNNNEGEQSIVAAAPRPYVGATRSTLHSNLASSNPKELVLVKNLCRTDSSCDCTAASYCGCTPASICCQLDVRRPSILVVKSLEVPPVTTVEPCLFASVEDKRCTKQLTVMVPEVTILLCRI